MSLVIWYQEPHPLTKAQSLYVRQEHDDSNPTSISQDIITWQRERYLTDITIEEFNGYIDAHRLLDILTQMLWERRKYGYPWRPVEGDAVPMPAGS